MVGRYCYDRFSTTNVVKMHVLTLGQKQSETQLNSCILVVTPRIGGWGLPKMTLGETKHGVSTSGEQPHARVKINFEMGSVGSLGMVQLWRGAADS